MGRRVCKPRTSRRSDQLAPARLGSALPAVSAAFAVGCTMLLVLPPPAIAPAARPLPPLSFNGFRAGMPVADARSKISAAGGSLTCKATSDWRMRECTGSIPFHAGAPPLGVLISSVSDSAAVLVFSTRTPLRATGPWVASLSKAFGRPNQGKHPGGRMSWQWIRDRRMLRVAERRQGAAWESSVTLTHGPLLDGLGNPQTKRPGE